MKTPTRKSDVDTGRSRASAMVKRTEHILREAADLKQFALERQRNAARVAMLPESQQEEIAVAPDGS